MDVSRADDALSAQDAKRGRQTICPYFASAFDLLGKPWNGVLLYVLMSGAKRFNELALSIPDIGDRMLSARLKELQSAGLVTRTVYPQVPVLIEYSLTDKGYALKEVLEEIALWAEQWCLDDAGTRTTL